jgi:chemotaxis signal transduction protein
LSQFQSLSNLAALLEITRRADFIVFRKKRVSSLLTFRVGPFRFCVDGVEAEAIIEKPRIRSVPGTPRSIVGVFSHRGSITVAVSLRRKFGLPDPNQDNFGQLIVARIADEPKGFWVDEVLDLHQDSNLQWQRLPGIRKHSIVDHAILIDDTIFLHTDFEKLFHAKDSGKLYKILSAEAGDQDPTHGPDWDLSSEVQQLSGNIRTGTAGKLPEMPEENPATRSPESGRFEKLESENIVSDETEFPTSIKTEPARSGFQRSAGAVGRMSSVGLEPAIRLYSGSGQEPNSTQRTNIKVKPYPDNIQYQLFPVHGEKTARKRIRTKMLMAGLMMLLILGAVTAFWWPANRHSEYSNLVGSVYAVKQKHNQLDSKPITPKPYDRSNEKDRARSAISPSETIGGESSPDKHDAEFVDQDASSFDQMVASVTIPQSNENMARMDSPNELTASITPNALVEERITAPSELDAVEKSEPSEASPSSQDTGEGSPGFESETRIENSSDTEELSDSNSVEKEKLIEDVPFSEKFGENILRVETDDFTLTIERPEIPQESQRHPPAVPPSKTPEERFIHIVVKGDTLWDIADHNLGNPFRYPELAQLSHIEDPHWIYPGDIITIIRKKLTGKPVESNN